MIYIVRSDDGKTREVHGVRSPREAAEAIRRMPGCPPVVAVRAESNECVVRGGSDDG